MVMLGPNLGDIARARLYETFTNAMAEGHMKPFVLPYSLFGAFILPTLWLTIPHTERPLVYHTRWLIMVTVTVFNLHVIKTASSTNLAISYVSGLSAAWGIISTFHLLVWTRPQFEAARAVRVSVRGGMKVGDEMRKGRIGSQEPKYHDDRSSSIIKSNGHPTELENGIRTLARQRRDVTKVDSCAKVESDDMDKGDLVVVGGGGGGVPQSMCVWERFPDHAPFLHRLNWALDLTTSFRCIGWTSSISSVPRPVIPAEVVTGAPVDTSTMSIVSRSGYKRSLTEREFLTSRLRVVVIAYLALDFLAFTMTKDPYFTFGPDYAADMLPPHLQGIPPSILLTYRQAWSLAGVYAAISAVFHLSDLAQYYLARRLFPARQELWQYTNVFGGFSQVLNQGLGGWWGSWWHQTFRAQFMAPSAWMIRNGYLKRMSFAASITTLCISFTQSGLLHASSSMSSIPETKPWRSFVFFALQIIGILFNQALVTFYVRFRPHSSSSISSSSSSSSSLPSSPPDMALRLGNLTFSLTWLYLTAPFFIDDLASAGIWLLEPVPISPLRAMGAGHPSDHWWRWDRQHFPKLHIGQHWWESGVAL